MVNKYSRDSKFKNEFVLSGYFGGFPNPFSNEFKIEAKKFNEPIRVSIFDVTGKKVQEKESTPESAQLLMGSTLQSGLYIVQVKGVSSNFSKSFKIIKK
jgi:hypothetical protein